MAISHPDSTLWYADMVNYLVARVIPPMLSSQQNKKFFSKVKHYYWNDMVLYKYCVDQLIRRCVPTEEMESILTHCPALERGGHFGESKTSAKVLQSGFYWSTLFRDAHAFVVACNCC